MVIGPTIGLGWILLLVIAVLIGIAAPRPWGIVIAIIIAMYVVGELTSNKLVIDKATETITVEKRHFLLIHRRRVIPFSRVALRGVTVEEKHSGGGPDVGGPRVTWDVCLVFGVPRVGIKKIRIDRGGNEREIRYIADEISNLLGK
ncbi:hypothetical protein ES703_33024 [subsurface metagenome]